MSHYAVTVRLNKSLLDRHSAKMVDKIGKFDVYAPEVIESALTEMLAPYNENVDGRSKYAEFEDVTDEYTKKWEEGTLEMVKCPDGKLRFEWDDMFRKPGVFWTGSDSHEVPADYERVTISYKDHYGTFEKFMKEYAGYKPNSKGRYGSYHNPNAKWDWYQIGGRWRGYFPVKPGVDPVVGEAGSFDNEAKEGGSDVVRKKDLDFDRIAAKEQKAFDKFKDEYRRFLAGEKFDAWDGPRDELLGLGLVRVEQDPDAPLKANEIQIGKKWGEEHAHIANTDRHHWRDVATVLPDSELEKYRPTCNPILPYAVLDQDGWHAAGEMGWWGMSSDTPDAKLAFAAAYVEKFIKTLGDEDVLVNVDCHI